VPTLDRIDVFYTPGQGREHLENRRRKPAPGMLIDAAASLELDLNCSWIVGDRQGNIAADHATGCQTILIDQGYAEHSPTQPPHFIVESFTGAVRIILAHPTS